MIPLRLYCIIFQMLTLSYTTDSLVMLTANSQDVTNIARKFLSKSLSNKIAEFIAKSSNKMAENIALKDTFGRNGTIDIESTKRKDIFKEDNNKNEHINRAAQQIGQKPARTTNKWLEPFKNNLENRHNTTEIGSNRDELRSNSLKNGKKNRNKTKSRYLPGDIENFKKDLMKIDMHYHKPNAVKMVKTKLEPILEDVEENEDLKGDIKEDKSHIKNDTPNNIELSYKSSTNKSIAADEANPVSSLYISEADANENKVVSFIKRNENGTNVENQIIDLLKGPKLRQPNLKYKKRYQYVENPRSNLKLNNKITKPKRFMKFSTAKKYYKRQPAKTIKNPNWSEEPEPLEKKQLLRKSKKSYLRDQLKYRYYPHHNYYYPIKPKVVPGKVDDTELLATKTANEDKIKYYKVTGDEELGSKYSNVKPQESLKATREEHKKIDSNHQTKNDNLTHHVKYATLESKESIKTDTHLKEFIKQHQTSNVRINAKHSKYNDMVPKRHLRYEESLENDKPVNENKETTSADQNIVAHFLTTKNRTPIDDKISKTTRHEVSDETTGSLETRITTAKEGTIMGTRSTVYHGPMRKDKSWEKQDMTHQQHKNKESVLEEHSDKEFTRHIKDASYHSVKNNDAFYHDEKHSVFHNQEKRFDTANGQDVDYNPNHPEDRNSREIKDIINSNVNRDKLKNKVTLHKSFHENNKFNEDYEIIKQEKNTKKHSSEEDNKFLKDTTNREDQQEIMKSKESELNSSDSEEDNVTEVTRGISATGGNVKLPQTNNENNENEALWKKLEKEMRKRKRFGSF